ncbi:DUF2306 domain-containing protein [Actomonas aquatica]|uniref:DUF2306 domain-containing protein n=1 Tax=Actomonas aquatica TaxID=2866162 RepID=A0ABZ1CCR9_9BACT|nr:DUF2306 domain-containing protein [Opitutus sp. WL0086]WRQ89473.1 DUF2306 domain-containing protein [Opitutus sp. WL0086]
MSSSAPPRTGRYWVSRGFLTLSALGVAGYALAIYARIAWTGDPSGHDVDLSSIVTAPRVVALHALTGAVALLSGLLQILLGIRFTLSSWHRRVGQVYVGAVLVSGLSGLAIAPLAEGGGMGKSGFALLDLCWLGITAHGWIAARRSRFGEHHRAMARSFALTCAAITLRLQLGLVFALGLPFASSYGWIAWLCWVPNLLVVEYWIRRRSTPS